MKPPIENDAVGRRRRIAVMGGSFNPPTLAHLALLRAAVDGVGAEIGYFVPTSFAYLKRKMRKTGDVRLCLSERMRFEMLTAMCGDDARLKVSPVEFGTVAARSFDTMTELQTANPDAEMFFVIGSDKVGMLSRWSEDGEFVRRFRYIVFLRGHETIPDSAAQLMNSPVALPTPEGVCGVSSTVVRQAFLAGRTYGRMLHPAVEELMRTLDSGLCHGEIFRFTGEYDFMGNRFESPIELRGRRYRTAEAAYWAMLCRDDRDRETLSRTKPDRLAQLAETMPKADGWESCREEVMTTVVRAKFTQNPSLCARLLATADALIVFGNGKGDVFWGEDNYTCAGENRLGRILMAVRAELSARSD